MKTHYKNKRFRVVSEKYPKLGLKDRFYWVQNIDSNGKAVAVRFRYPVRFKLK